ncbi:MBL fold metallo-hydrolase [uncultured Maritalea sp.]|uniref:MBL fold metallo-hydrolase n=1 Tax=uncultured Maritalea sp. TaxID=757249 RepID=UPI00261F9DF2|nr:MBL fold metallo-hydrolase [uncultured Maritalea sp.]
MSVEQKIQVTILGCGSSGGVPRVGGNWGDCDPKNPKNRRRRCALLITATCATGGQTNIVIDTGCDIREQLLDAGVTSVDAVFYTHDHADHTHGIDDLRVLALNDRKRVEVYANRPTLERLKSAFGYCFHAPIGSPYPPILNANEIDDGDAVTVEGEGGPVTLHAFNQEHGSITSLGFRLKKLAYSCDVSDIPKSSLNELKNLDVWIIDALRRTPHPSHFSLDDSVRWIEKMQPVQAYLTNMHIDLDYVTVDNETPENIKPAYDGFTIQLQ